MKAFKDKYSMMPEMIPAMKPIITTAHKSDMSIVPNMRCHTTDNAVTTPKVKKPCFSTTQNPDGKKGTFSSLVLKYETTVRIMASDTANGTAVPRTVCTLLVIESTEIGIGVGPLSRKYGMAPLMIALMMPVVIAPFNSLFIWLSFVVIG